MNENNSRACLICKAVITDMRKASAVESGAGTAFLVHDVCRDALQAELEAQAKPKPSPKPVRKATKTCAICHESMSGEGLTHAECQEQALIQAMNDFYYRQTGSKR